MKLPALLVLLPCTVHAACYTPPRHPISDKETIYPQKRGAQPIFPDEGSTTGPSAISIELPPQFLPPPWSPFSGLDSPPHPSSGVSPWDDSGRAQMIDNMPSIYNSCPLTHLDCRKCPLDQRCEPWVFGSSGSSSSAPPPIKPEDDGNGNCPLSKCDQGGKGSGMCGGNARCTRGYCVCELGWRGGAEAGQGWRGNEGVGALTVYVGPGTACDVKCDSVSCKEVPQLKAGVCWKSDGSGYDQAVQSGGSGSVSGAGLGTVSDSGAVGQAS